MTEYVGGATRVYRMSWWRRVFPMFFVAMGLLFFASFIDNGLDFREQKQVVQLLLATVFVLVGSFMTVSAFKSTITLTASASGLRTLSGEQKLPFSGIRGRRKYVVRGHYGDTRYRRLEPNDDRLPTIDFEFSQGLKPSSFFRRSRHD